MDIELFDLIFEIRKYDDAVYNEEGSIKCIRNIHEIFSEFSFIEMVIYDLANIISDSDTIYRNMITSYELHAELIEYQRISYVLGMTYTIEIENKQNNQVNNEKELGNLINQRWRNFQNYIRKNYFSETFIDDSSFQGILDQTRMDYGYMKRKS